MKVTLRFSKEAWAYPKPEVLIEINGPPKEVDEIVAAIREEAKNWGESWEEK